MKIKLSVPFFTEEDTEKYKNDFLNNLQGEPDELFAVIPLEPSVKSNSLNIKMESDTPSREGWVSEQKSTQN